MSAEFNSSEVMEIGGGRRLNAAPDALCVEVRGGGLWIRSRVVPYADIRAIYRYEKLDTTALLVLGLLWLALLVVVLVGGAIARWPALTMTLASTVVTLVAAGFGLFRARTTPARMLRIEAYSGVLTVPDRSPAFFQSMAQRIHSPKVGEEISSAADPLYGVPPTPNSPSAVENSEQA